MYTRLPNWENLNLKQLMMRTTTPLNIWLILKKLAKQLETH